MAELDEPIHLCAYDPGWPDLHASEARRIAAALPSGAAIEHIGSTSVPGLLAKPVIDIMVGVDARHEIGMVRATLASLGYQDMGEAGVPGRLYFRRRAGGAFNIHLVRCAGPIWEANLALRDYLQSNPDAAAEYALAKRAAVEAGATSLLAYSDRKSDTVSRLLERALDWKR